MAFLASHECRSRPMISLEPTPPFVASLPNRKVTIRHKIPHQLLPYSQVYSPGPLGRHFESSYLLVCCDEWCSFDVHAVTSYHYDLSFLNRHTFTAVIISACSQGRLFESSSLFYNLDFSILSLALDLILIKRPLIRDSASCRSKILF